MGLISRFRPLVAAALCLAGVPALYAQSASTPPGIPSGTELQSIEKILARPGVTAVERRDALIRLARLRQLSGDIEGAAKSWLDAARAEPEKSGGLNTPGDAALAAGAFCLAAMGEWEQASAAIGPLLASARQGPAARQARYLDACVKAWNSGDDSALRALADNPEYAELRSAIYYTLWKTAGTGTAEIWKSRLLAEFPKSPEGRIAADGTGDTVGARPSPLWLLFPGRGSFSLSAAPAGTAPSPAKDAGANPLPSPAAPAAALPQSADDDTPIKLLQTGLFGAEINARLQAGQLKNAGFSASVIRRMINGVEYWAVTVPSGEHTNRTILELKNAGFESFPLN